MANGVPTDEAEPETADDTDAAQTDDDEDDTEGNKLAR